MRNGRSVNYFYYDFFITGPIMTKPTHTLPLLHNASKHFVFVIISVVAGLVMQQLSGQSLASFMFGGSKLVQVKY
jgi:hypothetical protein